VQHREEPKYHSKALLLCVSHIALPRSCSSHAPFAQAAQLKHAACTSVRHFAFTSECLAQRSGLICTHYLYLYSHTGLCSFRFQFQFLICTCCSVLLVHMRHCAFFFLDHPTINDNPSCTARK